MTLHIYILRKAKHSKLKFWYKYRIKNLSKKYGIEISPNTPIGGGFQLIHPYGITINEKSIIGSNVTIFKGATIGSVRSGKREETPKIGNKVVLGVNSFVCGGITIGDNVLIAANSFVDFDVPNNSLVIGNPGKIYPKNNASKDYV